MLDVLLADGYPAVLKGNTVAPFMRKMERELAERERAEPTSQLA